MKTSPSYVVPSTLSHGIKLVNPMFRGYAQQVSLASPGRENVPFLFLLQ